MKIRLLFLVLVAVGLAFTPFRHGTESEILERPVKYKEKPTNPNKLNSRKV